METETTTKLDTENAIKTGDNSKVVLVKETKEETKEIPKESTIKDLDSALKVITDLRNENAKTRVEKNNIKTDFEVLAKKIKEIEDKQNIDKNEKLKKDGKLEELLKIVEKEKIELSEKHEKEVSLLEGDEILSDKDVEVLGIKTGSTPEAGGCLLALAKTKNGQEILTVVLGSPDRFGETKKLIEWVEKNVEWN